VCAALGPDVGVSTLRVRRALQGSARSSEDVAFDATVYNTWRMTGLLLLLSLPALYVVIRVAVRHGIEDAWERRVDRSPAEAADHGPVVRPLRDLSATWYMLLGAFGWFG
jgi:hypothetical protein